MSVERTDPHWVLFFLPQGAGNWLSHLNFDGQRYWTLAEDESTSWIPEPNPLPSDARFREDLIALAAADIKGSQVRSWQTVV